MHLHFLNSTLSACQFAIMALSYKWAYIATEMQSHSS
uniref:Uncharacterized protein n=1 Tax=Anguilla anguilla TaxID=7936 RepID=A0A0E9S578_ANGAN